jgi:hypothetical protein
MREWMTGAVATAVAGLLGLLLDRRRSPRGMIKPAPQKLIAQSTDSRFLNELNRELKG